MPKLLPEVPYETADAAAVKRYGKALKALKPKQIIPKLPDLHEEAFSRIECLQCARCCRNYSPTFKTTDIKRISKGLGLRESEFIETYLRLDEDGDYVTRSSPCPFIEPDNKCSIYDMRPGDCANYPYTDSDVLVKRPHLSLKNAEICPAVHAVLRKIAELVEGK